MCGGGAVGRRELARRGADGQPTDGERGELARVRPVFSDVLEFFKAPSEAQIRRRWLHDGFRGLSLGIRVHAATD